MYEYNAELFNVVDGDTVDAVVDLGFGVKIQQRFRLSGVDTPEKSQEGFTEARQFLTDCCLNKEVKILTHKKSKWGYYLIDIYVDDVHINQQLIERKLAKFYDGGTK